MKRVISIKRLLSLLLVAAVLGLAINVLHGFQLQRGARGLLVRASRAERAGQLDKAKDYLGRYLTLRPDDVEGLARFAELLERSDDSPGDQSRAFRVYRKALQLAGDRSDLRRRLVDLGVRSEQFSDILPHVEMLIRESPKDAELTYLLGRCEEAAGRVQKAVGHYEEARALDPSRVEAYTRLADLLRFRFREPAKADQIMDAREERDGLIAHNASSAAAYLARARYRQRYAIPGVDPAADIARALALAADDADALLAAAESASEKGNLKVAREHLQYGLDLHPKNLAMLRAMAELELREREPAKAVQWLQKGFALERAENAAARAALGWLLADTLITQGQVTEADEVVTKLRRMSVRPELLGYLEARMLVVRGKWGQAAQALQDLSPVLAARPELKDVTKHALVILARCYEHLGNIDQRFDTYRRAVAIDVDPDRLWAEARLGLASCLAELNRLDEALEQYRIVLPREPGAGLTLARLQIVQNLRRLPEEQRWDEVERTLGAVEKGLGEAQKADVMPTVAVLRAEALASQGKLTPARRLLERAIERFSKDVDLWVALANLAGREGKPEDMLAILDSARDRLGDQLELQLARVGYWVSRADDRAKAALAELERGAGALPAGDRTRLLHALALGYLQLGQQGPAKALWERLAVEQPDDLNLQLILFNQAIGADDEAGAEKALKEIHRIEEAGGPLGHYGEAILLIRRARREPSDRTVLTKALGELQAAAARRPSWSRVALALGDVDAMNGNQEGAIHHYLRAVLEMGEREPAVIARVLELLTARGRLAEAAQVVQKLRTEHLPLSGGLQRLVAQVSFQNGDPGRALEFAKKAVSAESKNPEELIWLGQIQWAAGQPADATLRRAVALAGDSPKAWLALILYLAGTGQGAQAEDVLKKAEQALSKEQAWLILAQGNEAVGRPAQAGELYDMAMKERPDDIPTLRAVASYHLRGGRRMEAEAILGRIIELGGTTTNAAWARRLLATLMATEGNYQRSLKALELLGLGSESSSELGSRRVPTEDLRTKARILSAQPNRARRREAIALVEELLKRREATPDDALLLASLYEADGDWPKAHQQMLELMTTQQKNPTCLAAFIRALLRHDRADEAEVYLAKLEPLASGKVGLIEIKARILVARGKAEGAVKLLKSFAHEDAARLLPAALLLEELKQTSPAEALYREYVDRFQASRPPVVLALAAFLGRQGRTKEALDIAETAWEKCPAEAVAQTCVRILYGNKGDTALDERVARKLEESVRTHPDAVPVQFDLANVRILQGRYADAEAIFRSIYERDNTLSAPLNNLAWLLALKGGPSADEALALISQAVERSGETPNLLDTRAMAHIAKGQIDTAIAELEDAIAVNPTAMEYLHLARAYQKKGRADEAVHAAQKAKGLGLTPGALHPLEREEYGPLLSQLK